MWRRAPQPIWASRKARATARVPGAPSAARGSRSKVRAPGGERRAQDVGLEAAADPVEEGEGRLARAA